ncbi:MAG: DUF1553 domain-containing protein, partial [Verrucomicrobiae bacterium]|nr:DUF1553 domain-containing protein [Verrucomicrobiae bacterium]
RNMPYDQFVSWQVAGDELAPQNPEALAATGFLGASAFPSVLTEREFETARYDELDDMVSTLGTAMLGTTVGCARCHDHKYDPVTMDDYYSLAANFTKTVRSYAEVNPEPQRYQRELTAWRETTERLQQELHRVEEGLVENDFREWLQQKDFRIPLERWLVMDPLQCTSLQGVEMEKQSDSSILLTGRNPEQETENLIFEFETRLQDIVALRMEALTHPTLPNQGPGRDHEGGFTIREVKVDIQDLGTRDARWKPVELASAEATSQENETSLSASAAINGVSQGWSIDLNGFGKDQALVIRFARPVGYFYGSRLRVTVSSGYNIQQMVGRPRFSITQDARAPVEVSEGIALPAYEALLKLLVGTHPEKLTESEHNALRHWYARNNPEWSGFQEKIRQHEWNRPVSAATRIQVSGDSRQPIWHRSVNKGFPSRYETTYRLGRGDVDQKVEPVHPGVLSVLNPSGAKGNPLANSRSSLAAWLTDVEEGAGSLLARVFVNRVWYYHFGTGLVDTPSDFGNRGGTPSHPELLEWLAWDFVKHGWDVKRLQRQILTSSTYRQSSEFSEAKSSQDGDDRLLWRFPPRRLEAEAIRDSLLQVSGLLDPRMFGPGSRDPDMKRRSVYFFIKRGALIPEMLLFDWPEHLVGIGQRSATTIAPQALQFLNSPQTRVYAEGFASRLLVIEESEARIRLAYQIAFGRFPDEEELRLGLAFVETQMETYPDPEYARKAVWIDYCHSLLSLNEFLYIR